MESICSVGWGAHSARQTAARSAFTLLELMLVLGLIVLIGAVVTPRLGEVFERQKLNGSANTLRLMWDRARLEAMRTGQSQVFECTLGTGDYSIRPLILQSDASNAGAGATVLTGAGSVVETQQNGLFTGADLTDTGAEKLEAKITFLNCMVAGDMRSYSVAGDAQTTGLSNVSTQTVAQRVIFYPDGSSSTAEVQIQNERGDVRGVQVRGLTGYSRVVAVSNVASTPAK